MSSGPIGRLSALLFLPIRRLIGPLHRRRKALSEAEKAERKLAALPPPWNTDGRWYPGDLSPRSHNLILPLIHGDQYFSDLMQELQAAKSRVTIAGWCISPMMPLIRGDGEEQARFVDVMREVSKRADVYLLLWSGAPHCSSQTRTRLGVPAKRSLITPQGFTASSTKRRP